MPSEPISRKIAASVFSWRNASSTRGSRRTRQYSRAASRTWHSSLLSCSSSSSGSSQLNLAALDMAIPCSAPAACRKTESSYIARGSRPRHQRFSAPSLLAVGRSDGAHHGAGSGHRQLGLAHQHPVEVLRALEPFDEL